jgi:integrase
VYGLLRKAEERVAKQRDKQEYIKVSHKETDQNGKVRETTVEIDQDDPALEEIQAKSIVAEYYRKQPTDVSTNINRKTFSPNLSVAIDEFCVMKVTDKKWDEKTHSLYRARLRLLAEALNDLHMDSVTDQNVNYVIDVLNALPPNRKKSPVYRNKSLDEIVTSKPKQKITKTLVNKHLTLFSSFFEWAKSRDYVQKNFFKGRNVRDKSKASKRWKVFSEDDLNKLFSKKSYPTSENKKYQYWVPLLGLYSGARLEELCQLHLEDIYKLDGYWIIDINDNSNDKKVKNEWSIRKVPVHPLLKEKGLIDFLQSLKARKEKRLFPELTRKRDGYGQTASRWFSRYRVKCGVTEKKKVFHSFRHTFINWLKQDISIDRSLIEALAGHRDESMTTGHYGEAYKPVILYEAISRIKYRPPF